MADKEVKKVDEMNITTYPDEPAKLEGVANGPQPSGPDPQPREAVPVPPKLKQDILEDTAKQDAEAAKAKPDTPPKPAE